MGIADQVIRKAGVFGFAVDRRVVVPIFLSLIRFYQVYISPKKGFSCAYAAEYGGSGCSGAIKSIIAQEGLFAGYPLARARLAECRNANEERKRRFRERTSGAVDGACSSVDDCVSTDVCDGVGKCHACDGLEDCGSCDGIGSCDLC